MSRAALALIQFVSTLFDINTGVVKRRDHLAEYSSLGITSPVLQHSLVKNARSRVKQTLVADPFGGSLLAVGPGLTDQRISRDPALPPNGSLRLDIAVLPFNSGEGGR